MAEPKIRFKRDDGHSFPDWESHDIGYYLDIRDQKEVPSEEAPLMAFIAYQGVADKGERYDRSFLVKSDDKKYKRTEYNDFIYSSNNLDVGSIGLNKYGSAVISVVYEIFKCKNNCNPDCINALLQMPQSIAKMLKYRQGALYGQYKIPAENFLSIKIDAPCREEQDKIADFLSSVDDVITVSEEEVANLETQKKAVMKKIFSQEVRFKRADGSDFPEWEYIPFEEIASLMTASIDPSKAGTMHCVELEYLEQGSGQRLGFVEAENQSSNKRLFETGDVLFGKLRPYLRKYWLATEEGCCSTEIWVLRPLSGVLSEYLLTIVSSDDFISVANTSEGTKMPRASWDLVANAEFPVPSFEEQHFIADFLSDFDEAIAAAKKELELWKKLKKGLLQQMFV